MDTVNEKTTPTLVCSFFDENGNSVTPSSSTYQIDDESGANITPQTAFTGNIALTTAETSILSASKPREFRRVTVRWNYGSGKAGAEEYLFYVKNLSKVT